MERVINIILGVTLVAFLVGITIYGVDYDSNYIYRCIDTQGNTIYCVDAYTSRGGMFGTMEDGTRVTITSYKLIEKEAEEK